MDNANDMQLTERQEQLLMQYADGAGSWWVDFRAKRLLDAVPAAQEFVESLRLIGESVSAVVETTTEEVDLWQSVERRIDAEQRAALYLGKRSFSKESSLFETLPFRSGVVIGVPVAACALLVAFLFLPGINQDVPTGITGPIAQTQQAPTAFIPVAANVSGQKGNATKGATAQFVSDQQHPWEVEWIRSDGRVRMIQHRSGRTPVLWIKRNEAIPPLRRDEVHTLKDGSELRIIDKRIPQVLSVANE